MRTIFFRLCAIFVPILLIFSFFRKVNGEEQLTFTYLLNTLSNFDFNFVDTKEVLENLVIAFRTYLNPANITGVVSFFEWLGSLFSTLIIEPINLIVAIVRDISSTLGSIFNLIFKLLGLQ